MKIVGSSTEWIDFSINSAENPLAVAKAREILSWTFSACEMLLNKIQRESLASVAATQKRGCGDVMLQLQLKQWN